MQVLARSGDRAQGCQDRPLHRSPRQGARCAPCAIVVLLVLVAHCNQDSVTLTRTRLTEQEETMEGWDQAKLESVINQKHSALNRPTDIVRVAAGFVGARSLSLSRSLANAERDQSAGVPLLFASDRGEEVRLVLAVPQWRGLPVSVRSVCSRRANECVA